MAAAKMDQFAALVQRNAELKFRNRILSDAVEIRNFQLQIARTGSHAGLVQSLANNGAAGAGSGAAGAAASGELRPWQTATTVAEAMRAPGSVRLLLAPELLPSVDEDSLRSMGRLQLLEVWRAHLAELSGLVLALESNPDDEAVAVRLRKAMADAGYLFRHVSITAPTVMMAFMQTHIETGDIAAPPPGHWQRVLATLELTPDQVADMSAMYSIFASIMTGILEDRRAIKAQLSKGLQLGQAADPRVTVARVAVPPEGEVLPALERNLRKEGAAHLLLRAFLFGRTMSVLQFARAAVHAYPFFPSATGLAAVAAGVVE